ncbi:PREDICTED: cell wall protein RTB1-like [Rhagoletis zephyria]|uniref:cell wall protein RTB1-like n=1 Tax=Rhagoletis zephyria TaxID=28612 RepID=UPI00081179D8|nr:PREDICTED: cell wall protein RTB1-like [Rhagoletis zephyria]
MEEYECEIQSVIGAPVDGSPTPSSVPSANNPTTSTTTGSSTSRVTPSTPAATSITTTTSLVPTSAPITTTTVNMRVTCHAGVTGNYPYLRNCRYYYRCSNGYHWLQDCGFSMSFDVIDGYCKSTKVARCSTESRRESFW